MRKVKRIVIIGPESTGKSTLCKQLAEYYNTIWCPEFAREYLLKNGTNYTYEDLLTIAKGQVALEENFLGMALKQWEIARQRTIMPLLFEDTDMYVMKVWCEYVFGKSHPFINDRIAESKADLYLLCNVDLPWVEDELREYPDLESRQELYDIYKRILVNQDVRWTEIKGGYDDRLLVAVKATDALLTSA